MKNFIQEGETLTLVATAITASGDLIKVGQLIGVASTDAAIGESTEAVMEGVFDLPKVAGAITAGDPLYYIIATNNLTKTSAAGLTLVGAAALDAANGDATVRAYLDGVIRLPVAA